MWCLTTHIISVGNGFSFLKPTIFKSATVLIPMVGLFYVLGWIAPAVLQPYDSGIGESGLA